MIQNLQSCDVLSNLRIRNFFKGNSCQRSEKSPMTVALINIFGWFVGTKPAFVGKRRHLGDEAYRGCSCSSGLSRKVLLSMRFISPSFSILPSSAERAGRDTLR